MKRVRYEDPRIAEAFDAVRARRKDSLVVWCERVATHLGHRNNVRGSQLVLDLGSGTGIWSEAIAVHCDVRVVGIEPSLGMLSRAATTRSHALVQYIGGRAEEIPLHQGSASAIWLSTVMTHIQRLEQAVTEMRRVLAPGSPVMIRSSFPGRQDEIELFQHFPTATQRAASWPRLGDVIAAFERGGFDCVSLDRVREMAFDTYDEFLEMLPTMRQTDSALVGIDDSEWEQGLKSIVRERDAGERPRPVGLDLLVFRRGGS